MSYLISPWKQEPDAVLHQALGKASEECGELVAALSRCIIQGYDESEPVTGKHNHIHLREEMADVFAALDWLSELRPELACKDSPRYRRKLNGFRSWQEILETDVNETRCIACDEVITEGDLVYIENGEGGFIHAECCGPERESFVDLDGNPLEPGDPLPEPFPFSNEVPAVKPEGGAE